MSDDPRPVHELFFVDKTGLDLRDMGPLHTCVCGSDLWHVLARFEEGVIVYYYLDMKCSDCGALAKAPTEIDGLEMTDDMG